MCLRAYRSTPPGFPGGQIPGQIPLVHSPQSLLVEKEQEKMGFPGMPDISKLTEMLDEKRIKKAVSDAIESSVDPMMKKAMAFLKTEVVPKLKPYITLLIVLVIANVLTLICISVVCFKVVLYKHLPLWGDKDSDNFAANNSGSGNNSASPGGNSKRTVQQARIEERRTLRASKYDELKSRYGLQDDIHGSYPHIGVQISPSREKLLKHPPDIGIDME